MDDADFAPGDVVVLTDLKGSAELNGKEAVVRPRDLWPTHEGRVGIQLRDPPKSALAVKPCNLRPAPPACFICLERSSGSGDELGELLSPGCGCRGSAGRVHERCAVHAAAAEHARAGTWAGKHPWQLCPTCKLPYTGALKLVLAEAWCARADARADGATAGADLERFAARTALSNALSASGRLAEAETVVRANLEAAVALHGAEHRHTLGTRLNLGLLLDGQGKHREAAAVYAGLLAVQRRTLGDDHRDTLSTRMQLAGAALQQGKNAAAEAQYRDVLTAQTRLFGASDPAALTCAMNLASALLNQAKFGEAEGALRDNLALKERKLGPEHVDTLMAKMNLGSALKEVGRYADAEACFRDNHETKRRVLGATHADTAYAALNLVGVWVDGGQTARLGEAEELVVSTREALRRAFGEAHPSVLGADMHHGAVLHARGEHARAADVLRRTHAAQVEAHGGETHPDALETAWRLGALLAAPNTPVTDAAEAASLLRATAAHQAKQLGSEHPRTSRSLVSLGEALLLLSGGSESGGGADEAARLFEVCEAAQSAVLDATHPDLIKTRSLRAALADGKSGGGGSASQASGSASVVHPTAHAVATEARLREEAASWDAPTDASTIPWAAPEDIPVINLGPYLAGEEGALEAAAAQLRAAALSTGFHYIVGHGVPRAAVDDAFDAAVRFHRLPDEQKEALAMDAAPARPGEVRAGCGYLREANTKLPARPKPNMNAAFVVKRECGPRDVTLEKMPWPDEVGACAAASGFRTAVEAYCGEMERLARSMLPVYATALGLAPDFFDGAFEQPLYRLRLSRYAPTPPGEYGINPHVDTSFFTILRPSAAGLVVQTRGGGRSGWVRAPFRGDDSFVVNFGELLAQVTNDTWPATRHYALNGAGAVDVADGPEGDPDRAGAAARDGDDGARYALPFFFNATPTHRMAVVPTCCSAENPPRYPPTSYLEGQGVLQGE